MQELERHEGLSVDELEMQSVELLPDRELLGRQRNNVKYFGPENVAATFFGDAAAQQQNGVFQINQ